MHVPYIHRPSVLSQEVQSERRARREVYRRSSRRHFMRRKQSPAIQLDVRCDTSARGENPFQIQRIHSCSVRGVSRLEHNKRRHRFHRNFESSIEKTRPVRSRQDPPIANSGVPYARILGPARNRATAPGPDLELAAAFLRAILGNGKRSRQKQSKKECQKKRGCVAIGSCHKYLQSRKRIDNERYANRRQETNPVATIRARHPPPAPAR
jgi:hypothetical protein